MRAAAFFLFSLLFAVQPARASEFGRYKGAGIAIRYERPMRSAAAGLAALYPAVKADLEAKTGWSVNFTPEVVLIRKNRVFLQIAGSDLVTAYAVPEQDLIVIDYAKMERTPFDLQATTEHELCHLLVHRMISSDIPRWLDEGVAQWASGGISDIINPGEKDIIRQAVLSHRIIRLRDLSSAFPAQPRDMILAYEESRSFIDFIVREYGAGKLRAMLHEMAKGKTIPEAFTEVLSADLSRLEEKWREGLVRKYTWPAYVSGQVYWVLFFAAALVTFIGYLRLRRRMKDYRDEEEESDYDSRGDGRGEDR